MLSTTYISLDTSDRTTLLLPQTALNDETCSMNLRFIGSMLLETFGSQDRLQCLSVPSLSSPFRGHLVWEIETRPWPARFCNVGHEEWPSLASTPETSTRLLSDPFEIIVC